MNPGKLTTEPQFSRTSGGAAFLLSTLSSVGTQHRKRASTASTTWPWPVDASKNISRVSLHGSAPLNSGGLAFLAFRAGLRSHFADFWIDSSLGLNWNWIWPIGEAGCAPPAAPGLASYKSSVAFAVADRAPPPDVVAPAAVS